MDSWDIINIIGYAVIFALCSLATLCIVGIVLCITDFILNRRDQRAQKRQQLDLMVDYMSR